MSKKWDEERWGPHVHCIVCGNAMAEGKSVMAGRNVCSPECQTKFDKEAQNYKRQQKYNYLILGLMGASILLFFVLVYF